ncbi:MAG: hypothetical protein QF896_05150 [Acidimicrobiales bacterium]|jgi:hypothetical protein|nr:hypothetical protein [Acidimicrobiales bacterium]|tara:strand:- start:1351 stop:1794 length:444 start_codon:yes stop_codon:yes gene_type:complete
MRHGFLMRSVGRLLQTDEKPVAVALMWTRHRWMMPYTAAVSVAVIFLATAGGVEFWSTRLGIGAAGAIVAATATTNYSVLARTTRGLLLCRAGRVRQVATVIVERLPEGTPISRTGGNLITGEWDVGDRSYSVPRRHERAMEQIVRP